MPKPVLLLVIFVCIYHNVHSQLFSTEGKEFWLSFTNDNPPEVFVRLPRLTVFVMGKRNCSGRVANRSGSFTKNFTVTAGSVTTIDVTSSLFYTTNREVIAPTALYMQATDTVQVYASLINEVNYDIEATAIIPVSSLGSEYMVVTHDDDRNSVTPSSSQFMVVGVEDSTEVEIHPNHPSLMGTPAGPFTILLNKGDTYLYASNFDLTGSFIRTKSGCKKIAVYSGNEATFVGGCLYNNHLFEQSFPLNTLGTTFLVTPSLSRHKDYIKIAATQDYTRLYINGASKGLLAKGQTYEGFFSQPAFIRCDKPVITARLGVGTNCDSSDGGPYLEYITPVEQAVTSSRFATLSVPVDRFTTYRHYLNVHVRTSERDQTFLDGQNIGSLFTIFPAQPEYSYARMELTEGAHDLENAGGFTANLYGFVNDHRTTYSTSAGSRLNKFNQYTLVNGISSNVENEFYLCPPQSITFEAVRQDTLYSKVYWFFGDGTTDSGNVVQKTFADTGCYTVQMVSLYTGSSGNCLFSNGATDTTTTKICVLNTLAFSLGADVYSCKDSLLTLQPNVMPAGFSYTWSTGDLTPAIQVDSSGIYRLQLQKGTCMAADTVNVYLANKPLVNLGADKYLCLNDSLLIQNEVNDTATQYEWSNGVKGYRQYIKQPGTYILRATKYGCTVEDSIKAELFTCPEIYMPTAFTPNNDGRNDVIRPIVAGLDLQQFQVYNRWGQLVFQTSEPQRGWDGKVKNVLQQTETFAYIVTAKDKNGKTVLKKGVFVLMR